MRLLEQVFADTRETIVSGRHHEPHVEAVVRRRPGVEVALAKRAAHLRHVTTQGLHVRRAVRPRGKRVGGLRLEPLHDVVHFADVLDRKRHDADSAARNDCDEALVLQLNQRLAHRRAAHADRACKILLEQVLPAVHAVVEHQLLDLAVSALRERGQAGAALGELDDVGGCRCGHSSNSWKPNSGYLNAYVILCNGVHARERGRDARS